MKLPLDLNSYKFLGP